KGGEPEITAENKIYKGSIDILKDQTYTQAGEYVYEIKETIPSTVAAGYTYDETSYRVTVTVKDDQNGNLIASDTVKIAKSTGKDDNGQYVYGEAAEVTKAEAAEHI
ncbi:hypothetical protein H5999_12155, partial [[Clostridium] spiroforme]|nr:hypothetical protein [Thomasclavelia spiroformis]